ncbi:hypothetical protein BOTBODRAFT_49152 [Botryobasidium botryosum FD-172 SS1]|uniref:Uncharacterized protein n=1 Tax=Botryobasidium botryosum (strain FD-172 SS1) TaxID=930990 RepID=A0A067LWZ8_BOTB1|nr:hypothetical protein BOTBODRAFT_49152 [Botryobasidium botryosum FD-172 SS1]
MAAPLDHPHHARAPLLQRLDRATMGILEHHQRNPIPTLQASIESAQANSERMGREGDELASRCVSGIAQAEDVCHRLKRANDEVKALEESFERDLCTFGEIRRRLIASMRAHSVKVEQRKTGVGGKIAPNANGGAYPTSPIEVATLPIESRARCIRGKCNPLWDGVPTRGRQVESLLRHKLAPQDFPHLYGCRRPVFNQAPWPARAFPHSAGREPQGIARI